jgi:undecaprenyl-diphosphatase
MGLPAPLAAAGTVIALVGIGLLVAGAAARRGLGIADAALLGLVEGITEWLPISSTGHLTVTQNLLGIDGSAADSYAIAIQAGAILAVLGLYHQRFSSMVRGVRGDDPEGRHAVVTVALACLPAVVVGLVFEDAIKEHLFGTWPVVVAWAAGGVVILAVAAHRRGLDPAAGAPLAALTWRSALIVGFAQTLALWPGVSRSLVTILAATAVGLSMSAAVEFSFLVGFVVLGGATLHELVTSGDDMVAAYGLVGPLVGLAIAFVTAAVAMRWMVGYLTRHGLAAFGWYRLGAAAVVAALLLTGAL